MLSTPSAAILKARQSIATEQAAERLIMHMPRPVWRAYMAQIDQHDPRAAAAILIAWIVSAEIEMEEALDAMEFGEITR